jgi:hypothetical protein
VAEDAVRIEPVSDVKFPLSGKRIGNFMNSRGHWPFNAKKIAHIPGVRAKFPVKIEPGILWFESGNLGDPTGNLGDPTGSLGERPGNFL